MRKSLLVLALLLPAVLLLAFDRRPFATDAAVVIHPWGVQVVWVALRRDCDVRVLAWHSTGGGPPARLPVVDMPGWSYPAVPWPAQVTVLDHSLAFDEVVGAYLSAVCNPVQTLMPVVLRPSFPVLPSVPAPLVAP